MASLLSAAGLFGAVVVAGAVLGCSGNTASGNDPGTCSPASCESLGANCGQALDGCGGVLECGSCIDGQTCGAGGPNVCAAGTCDGVTCQEASLSCGLHHDGCSIVYDCGGTCSDGGTGTGSGTGTGTGTGTGSGGGTGTGSGGGTGTGTGNEIVINPLGLGVYQGGGGPSDDPYAEGAVLRDGDTYFVFANGWGESENRVNSVNFEWTGTSFVVSMSGQQGGNYEPFGYPSVFCGNYSDKVDKTRCGLPKAISELTTLKTGWRWSAAGNTSAYNAAWDVWLGDGTNLQSYLMVWLRDPPEHQPAGSYRQTTTVANNGSWDVWAGQVFGRNIVNFVRPEGQDLSEAEFDMLDFYRKAKELESALGVSLPGTHINSVAVGFELWQAVTNLETIDFYVDPRPR